jgi:drug/metabolite transporter (DMT)-like permease
VFAALCYGVASVMQAIAARAASRRPAPGEEHGAAYGGVDPGLLVRMLHQWRFVASLGLDMLGFLAQLVALHRLPLFAVQAMIAANLAVTAVCATWLVGAVLSWREWMAVGGVVTGVGLLGSSAGPEGATQAGVVFKLALIVAVAALGLAGMAAGRLPNPFRTPLLGLVAGTGYGIIGVAARVLNGFAPPTLIRDPATYALIAAGIVSFLFYASALEGGSVTVATAAVVLAETLPPAAVGVVFLGDRTRPGLGGVAIAGFALAVCCAVALARFGEAHHDDGDSGPGGEPVPQLAGRASDRSPGGSQNRPASDRPPGGIENRPVTGGQSSAGPPRQRTMRCGESDARTSPALWRRFARRQ